MTNKDNNDINNDVNNDVDNMLSDLFFQTVAEDEQKNDFASENDDTLKPEASFNETSENTTKNLRTTTPHIPKQSDSPVKKKVPFVPIIVVCALLAVIAIGITYVLQNGKIDKKESLADYDSMLSSLFDFSSPMDDVLGIENLEEIINNGNYQIKGDMNVENLANTASLNGIVFDYEFLKNFKANAMALNLSASYNKAKILSLQSFLNEEALKFKIPAFSESVYSQDIPAGVKFNSPGIISTYIYAIKKHYPDDFKSILEGITANSTDADSYQNAGTSYTISEKSIELFIYKALCVTFEDKELADEIKEMYSLSDEDFESIKDSIKDFDQIISALYSGDISFSIWKNHNGLITKLQSSNEININDEIFNVDFTIDSYGDENPSDNMTISLYVDYNENKYIALYDRTTNRSDVTTTNDEFTFITNSETVLNLVSNQSFDTTTNDYTLDITADFLDVEPLTFSLYGTFTNISKGKSFDLAIDNILINQGYNNVVNVSGNLSFTNKNEKIKAPSGSNVNIDDLSTEELNSLIEEFSNFFKN